MTRAPQQRFSVILLPPFRPSHSDLLPPGSQWRLGLQNGALFAAPLPEEFEAQGAEIQAAIDQAVEESEANGVSKRGKEVTPWLLARVAELTAGKSLQSSACSKILRYDPTRQLSDRNTADIALLENTAVIGEWPILPPYRLYG